ncbi:cytochrome D1 domain-containing protein, partial [Pseudomonas sp. MD330_11]|uniref:cytochrome D1 domain-containing protein n=1 Tax=Pseudomonas sp. MD330_11 TaxID=3241255 RepID=UPI0036D2CD6A
AVADNQAFVPAVARHQVLVMDARSWQTSAANAVAGQPIIVTARPDGRQLWVNFANPDNDRLQEIDSETHTVVADMHPRPGV